MKCPNCGEEITRIIVESTELTWIKEVYEETEDGLFKYAHLEDEDTVDSEIEQILCPKCGKPIDPDLIEFKRR